MSKPTAIVYMEVSLKQKGKMTERVSVTFAPTARDTAEELYYKLIPLVSGSAVKHGKSTAEFVAENIKDVLAKHGKKVAAIV